MSTAKPERVLVVGAGPFQVDLIASAKALGAEVIAVDRLPDAPGMALADHACAIDIIDADAVVDLARRMQVDAVLTAASDAAVSAVAAVVDALRLPGLGRAAVATCRDKLRTFEAVRAAGLPAPETRAVGDGAGLDAAILAVGGFPLVVKPASAAGGRGVAVVERRADLDAAVDRARGHGASGSGVLLQAYVGGRSVGVEAFFWEGEVAAAFVLDDQYLPPFVSPIGHSLPSGLDAATQARVVVDVARFAAAVGITHGPLNFDLRREDDRTVLIEINPRLGGSSITEMVRTAFGADLSTAAVTAALGRRPHAALARTGAQAVASRLIVARGRGRVTAQGDPAAPWRDRPDVRALRIGSPDGRPAPMAVDEWSLLGSCLVVGQTREAAERLAAEVAAGVAAAITVEP